MRKHRKSRTSNLQEKDSAEFRGEQTMATKKTKRPSKKVKTLRAKSLSAKQAKGVKGGGANAASKQPSIHFKYDFKY